MSISVMNGKLIDLSISREGKQRLTIEIDEDFREQFDSLCGNEIVVQIKKRGKMHSLAANAYLHHLINRIAQEKHTTEDEIKKMLVLDYGPMATECGKIVGIRLPSTVNPDKIYPYTKCYEITEENGIEIKSYFVYKRTSDMDSSEMSKLIDGAIEMAHECGICTDTPQQIERLKESWRKEYGK